MQVFKIEKPILALSLLAVADGNNFKELSAEVSEVGGSAELINDELARVAVNGRTYDLPIGYVLVMDGGSRLLSKAQFDVEYVSVGVSGFDLDDLVARLDKVETELSKLAKANAETPKPKSEPKAKADKASESTVGT